jgi:signal transduction histidine kinase
MITKRKSSRRLPPHPGLVDRYLVALRRHLCHQGPKDRPQSLGRVAFAQGLLARDLAKVHEQAVVRLAVTHDVAIAGHGAFKRASRFFLLVLTPFASAEKAARTNNRVLRQRHENLRVQAAALARTNQRLEREVAGRKLGEAAIREGKEQYRKLFQESQLMQRNLRRMARQVLSAQEEERKQISRELHDQVVQTLVGINVQLSALSKGAADNLSTLQGKIARTQKLVEHSVNEVHRFARELRPAVLDDLGLIPALHAYSKNLASRHKLKIQLTVFAGVEELPSAKRTVLYRVAQEALTNVVRHARASQASVIINRISGTIRMEISDNGGAFPVEKTLRSNSNKRLGLIGMMERIEMIGGSLVITSAPGVGTTVRAEIPFHPEKARP